MQKGLVHTNVWQLKIRRDFSAAEVPTLTARGPRPSPGSPARKTSAGKRSPRNSWL